MNAYIVPHPPLAVSEIGKGGEDTIQRTLDAYGKISSEIADIKPETIIFISPHSVMYRDYIHISPGDDAYGDFSSFDAKHVNFKTSYDTELINELNSMCKNEDFPAGTSGEKDPKLDHGVMVPMYFINKEYNNYKAVRIGISGLTFKEHYQFGNILRSCIDKLNKNAVIIASGDLSHRLLSSGPYGYSKEGPVFDERICSIIKSNDLFEFTNFSEDLCDAAGECGLRSFIIMAGALEGKRVNSKLLSYEGPFGVGYAVGSFVETSAYVDLAKKTLEYYVLNNNEMELPKDLPEELLNKRAGVFVSLKKDGELRGCIGTISPTQKNIAIEIMNNALSSGLNDPRFPPVTFDELDSLEYSVDVLDEPEDIPSKDLLDVENYGVIVSKGFRRGLLLPNLEGVDSVDDQVSIALRKAGISEDENYSLQRFKVERFK